MPCFLSCSIPATEALLVGRKRARQLSLRGATIQWQSTVKYLGCLLDQSLRMRPQATAAINSAKMARSMLRPILTSHLPLRTRTAIYKTYIRSRLTYAMPAWYGLCSAGVCTSLQAQQNISLRVMTGAGRYVRNDVIARDVGAQSIEHFIYGAVRAAYV